MRKKFIHSLVSLVTMWGVLTAREPVLGAKPETFPCDQRLALTLHAGPHDRADTFVSVLIKAGPARSVFVQYADGTLGRAQLVEPGLLNASARDSGKKELHFIAPKLAREEQAQVTALLSEKPVEGRTYVWSGEPRQSRRVSCMPCHQGLSPPTAAELRQEGQMLEQTGKVPPLVVTQTLPTARGADSRWHEKLGRNFSSACWECHTRHMVQYEFGQSLEQHLPWAPDPPQRARAAASPTVRSVFHTVFRVRGGRTTSHPLPSGEVASAQLYPWGIHYGFEQATAGAEPCSEILQQHVSTLSEEAGKFIGRHNVRIDWVGKTRGQRQVLAREERQLTVKDYRGRNKSYAMWIDFVSTLTPAAGAMRLDGARQSGGFRFVPALDGDTVPEYRESAVWRAITFVSEGTTYTAVCVNHPSNPPPTVAEAAPRDRVPGPADRSGLVPGVGYSFSAECNEQKPLLVHYRLWIQGGAMPVEEIQSLANDFVEPIEIVVK